MGFVNVFCTGAISVYVVIIADINRLNNAAVNILSGISDFKIHKNIAADLRDLRENSGLNFMAGGNNSFYNVVIQLT